MLSNGGAGEVSWESLGQQEIKSINLKESNDWCWSWSSNLSTTWCEEQTHWKRPWSWKRLKAGGEEDGDRGWDGWMASSTQWTRVWANSSREWRRGKPGVLQSTGSQGVGHDTATEQQQLIQTGPFLVDAVSFCLKYRSFSFLASESCFKINLRVPVLRHLPWLPSVWTLSSLHFLTTSIPNL